MSFNTSQNMSQTFDFIYIEQLNYVKYYVAIFLGMILWESLALNFNSLIKPSQLFRTIAFYLRELFTFLGTQLATLGSIPTSVWLNVVIFYTNFILPILRTLTPAINDLFGSLWECISSFWSFFTGFCDKTQQLGSFYAQRLLTAYRNAYVEEVKVGVRYPLEPSSISETSRTVPQSDINPGVTPAYYRNWVSFIIFVCGCLFGVLALGSGSFLIYRGTSIASLRTFVGF